MLPIKPDDHVLDMCAAPSGKTLILHKRLGSTVRGQLMANEPHSERRKKLINNIRKYIPESLRQNTFVTELLGELFSKSHPNYFDSILIDAPCPGERFFLKIKTL